MNSKHLARGSPCPPPPKDKTLRIYNMRFCPYAQRAVLVAIAKGIPHEIVNCNLADKPEWIFEKNPGGKVPVLEDGDKILYESLVVCDYLDEIYPNRPLNSKDAFQKALDRLVIEEFNKVITLFYKMAVGVKQGDATALKASIVEFQKGLVPIEQDLEKRGTTFFAGNDAPGMVDYMIWPWVERVPVIKLSTAADGFDFEGAKRDNPRLEAWRKAMKEDDAVKKYNISPEIHKKFIDSHLAGKAEYDLLLQ